MSTNDPTWKKTTYQQELEGLNATLARLVAHHIPEKGVGFILFMFDHVEGARRRGDGNGFMSYCSNSERASCIAALKEWIARAEAEAKAGGGPS